MKTGIFLALICSGPAVAQDLRDPLPTPPMRSPDVTSDCTSKAPALAGTKRDCDAISVPPAYLAYLEETRIYSQQLRLHLVASQAVADADARTAADALAWRDQRIAQLEAQRAPSPTLQVMGWVGVGVVLTVGSAWAMGQMMPD